MFKKGEKVRFQVQRNPGQTKTEYLPSSKDIYTIVAVREPTRSYVLELNREGYRPLKFWAHHRKTKKVFVRPERLSLNLDVITTTENTDQKMNRYSGDKNRVWKHNQNP